VLGNQGVTIKMAFKKGDRINLGRIRSEESKEKNRLAHLGKPAWNKGLTKETDSRVAKYAHTKQGKKFTEEHISKLSKAHKGQVPAIKGKHFNHTEIAKEKIRINAKTNPNYGMKNKNHSQETIKKLSGENSYWWQGGISFEPYTTDWTETLKKSIRERDHYTCQICKGHGHHVHHIDYNKRNCNPDNLITVCIRCHGQTNNNRKKWIEFFKQNLKF
jgi:hypothetical protein